MDAVREMVQTGLPVTRMVLYKHGVGFIERAGSFGSKDEIKLNFKRDEMDDILKSLSIFTKGKSQVTGVSYETADDVAKLLAEKAINVPDREAMVGLLRALKGYRIKIWVPGEEVEGKVVGTDEEVSSSANGNVLGRKCSVVIQSDDEKIRSFDIASVSGMQVKDVEAKDDLKFYLDAITSIRKKNVKGLTIFMDGANPELSVSYIAAMPSWRVSYRLAYFKGDKTLLQGWGIIDNRLDEDLKDVQLSLVAGKPISFIYDIYTPRIIQRPIVREEVRTVSAPVELESGMAQLQEAEPEIAEEMDAMSGEEDEGGRFKDKCAKSEAYSGMRRSMAPGKPRSMAMPSMAPPPSPQQMADSTRVQTKSVEMGEFFRYDIETPVTVKRGQSAMVPIIQCPITCKKEHVYNGAKMPRNPVVTMRIKNNSGLVLERGPIVVLDEGTYVGEAILPYTTIDSENHVAYSVDLGVNITEKQESESHMKAIHIKNRYFQKEYLEFLKTEYTIENKKTEAITLVVEHPKREYELTETPNPTEKTESFFRWALEVKPKTQTKFNVKEVKTVYYSENIRSLGVETLKSYLDSKYIQKTSYEKISEIIELQKKIYVLQQNVQKLENERNQIYNEQGRLRQNLGSLGSTPQEQNLRSKYISTMEGQEKRLEQIKAEIEKTQAEIQTIDRTIEQKLGALV